MYEAEEIFGLIPEGYFDDAESFVDYVNSNGIEEFWDFMPEGYWDTKEDFLAGLKKKARKMGLQDWKLVYRSNLLSPMLR